MAFRFRRLTPVSRVDAANVSTQITGIRMRIPAGFSGGALSSGTKTAVQKNAATTQELQPVSTVTTEPDGNADPATTTQANVDAKAAIAKDLALAQLKLKNYNGQIVSQEQSIARQQAELAVRPSKWLGRAIKVGQIKSQQKYVDELKLKAQELQVEIDRLKALI